MYVKAGLGCMISGKLVSVIFMFTSRSAYDAGTVTANHGGKGRHGRADAHASNLRSDKIICLRTDVRAGLHLWQSSSY